MSDLNRVLFNLEVAAVMRSAIEKATFNAKSLEEMALSKDKVLADHGEHWRGLARGQEEIAEYWTEKLVEFMRECK